MNIAIVIPTIKAGGAEKQAVILAQCLSKEYCLSFFIFSGESSRENKHLDALQESNVEVVYLFGSLLTKIKTLTYELSVRNISVAFNYLTMCDGVGCYAERKAGVKTIYNGIRSSWVQKWKEIIERYCHNHWATGTIFNSYSAADIFKQKGFNNDKCIVIQNCFPNISPFTERPNSAVKTIITVGRFDPVKDYETAIKTVSTVYSKNPNIRYIIVGYGALEKGVRQWVNQYGIQDITDIYINPSNIQELLMGADIFLSTSLYEGTSNAVMEALNASLPVVCTDVGDNSYLVIDNYSGFVHKIGDVPGLSSSIMKLIDNHEMRLKFGLVANQNLVNNYSVNSFYSHYSALLTK